MYLQPVFLCLALVGQAIGVQITHPTAGTNWTTSGESCMVPLTKLSWVASSRRFAGPNIISWKVDHGDPLLVNIQLAHNNNSSFKPIPGLLSADGIIATGINVTIVEMLFTPSWRVVICHRF
jgi:hypothetical protein